MVLGTYVTANRCQNQDIFFAIRGGGGSTFAVNMEVTYRAHPKVNLQTAEVAFLANNITTYNSFISILTENANKWADDGWGGYINFGVQSRYLIEFVLFTPILSYNDSLASLNPVLSFINTANGTVLAANVTTTGSFWDTYQSFIGSTESVAVGGSLASRLIPRSVLDSSVSILILSHV